MFTAKAEVFDRNRGTAAVKPAMIHRPDGPPLPGVHIHQVSSNAWIVITETEAIKLAHRIADTIETQRKRKSRQQ